MNTSSVQDRLKAFATKTEPDTASVEETRQFTEPEATAAPKEETPEQRERREKREKQASIVTTIKNTHRLSDEERKLRTAITKHMRYAGFICANGEKVDFTTKTITAEDKTKSYDFILRQAAPSAIKAVILMVPTLLMDLLSVENKQDPEYKKQFAQYSTMSSEQLGMKPIIKPWAEIGPYIQANTMGYITEAEELFEPYYKKSKDGAKAINSPADVTGRNGIPNGSAIYIMRSLRAAAQLSVKHTFRSKIATDKNLIPIKKYKTVPMKDVYSAEEAKEMIEKYLGRFTKQKDGVSKTQMYKGGTEFTIKADTGEILSTSYFPQAGTTPWLKTAGSKITHWSKKDPKTGEAAVVSEPMLVARKQKQSQKDPSVVTYPYDYETLTAEGATISNYHFDANTFGPIIEATHGLLSFEAIQAASKTTSKRKGQTSDVSKKTVLVGEDLLAVDEATIIAQLKTAGLLDA